MLSKLLNNWSIVKDPYLPPESNGRLHGDDPDGLRKFITTSQIVTVDGNLVTTASGSIYQLGKVDPKFLRFCIDNGFHIPTDKEPIRIHSNE